LLFGVVVKLVIEENGMWSVQNYKCAQHLRVMQGERPCNRAADVVSDENELLVPEMTQELADVLDQRAREVRVYVLRLGGQVVAAKIGRHSEMIARELGELVTELLPALWKPWRNRISGTSPAQA
jgi:hypothetical protein